MKILYLKDCLLKSEQNELVAISQIKLNGLNNYWSIRFLVISLIFIGCFSLINVAYV